MKNLNDLNIEHAGFDLEHGFFWIEFSGGKELQCCLNSNSEGGFIAKISKSDNGHDFGISAEVNNWAVDKETNEWSHINDFLIEQAMKAGLEITE